MKGVARAIVAVAYREAIWFKRFVSDYIVAWILPLFFGLGIVFLPASIGGVSRVLARMSSVLGAQLSLSQAIAYSLALSSVISLVSAVVGDIIQTCVSEVRVLGVLDSILLGVDLGSYVVAVAMVRSIMMGFFSTLYLPIALTAVLGMKGIITYLVLTPALLASSIALGLYATAIALPIAFYANISRPWTVTSLLIPALLAGAGLYIPAYMVPAVLRAIAFTSPVPELCDAIRIIILKGFSPQLITISSIVAALLAAYIAFVGASARACGSKVKRGW